MGLFSRSPESGPGLPEYVIVTSPRARHVRLTIRAGEPVRVTLPRGVPQRAAAEAVASSLPWIERTRARVESRADAARARVREPLPDVIELPGLGTAYAVRYRMTAASGVRAIERDPGVLTVEGHVTDEPSVRAALRRWLQAEARGRLPAAAELIANEVGCEPRSITVTWPRKRWGSCTASGDIRLSAELVFLPPVELRAIVVHELAHLRVLDHSKRFYAEVQRLDPSAPSTGRRRSPRHETHTPGWALRLE